MKNAPKRWSVNAMCDGMSRISYFCDGRPLASDSQAERETLSPVQQMLVGLAGCFALSCQAIFLKKRLKGIGLEVVVTAEKSASPNNRLSAILVSAIFHGDLTSSEAAVIVEEAKPLCTVANTVLSASGFAYETRIIRPRFPVPEPQLFAAAQPADAVVFSSPL
jgi:uncharacterized OsmC-like protein